MIVYKYYDLIVIEKNKNKQNHGYYNNPKHFDKPIKVRKMKKKNKKNIKKKISNYERKKITQTMKI